MLVMEVNSDFSEYIDYLLNDIKVFHGHLDMSLIVSAAHSTKLVCKHLVEITSLYQPSIAKDIENYFLLSIREFISEYPIYHKLYLDHGKTNIDSENMRMIMMPINLKSAQCREYLSKYILEKDISDVMYCYIANLMYVVGLAQYVLKDFEYVVQEFQQIFEIQCALNKGKITSVDLILKNRAKKANDSRWQGHVEQLRRNFLELDDRRQSEQGKKLTIKAVATWIYQHHNEHDLEYETIREHLSKARKGIFTND